MTCWVAYDVRDSGLHQLWFAAIGLAPVAVGLLFLRFRLRRGFVWIGFGVLWSVVLVVSVISEYVSDRRALNSGQCSYTEGVVQNWRPARHEAMNKASESFDAGGRHFTLIEHLPVEDGKHVRIWHRNGDILRLETCFP